MHRLMNGGETGARAARAPDRAGRSCARRRSARCARSCTGPLFGKLAYWIVIVGAVAADALARARRCAAASALAWGLIGAGSLLWACGDVYWTLVLADDAVIPVPSLADAGYLAFYPLVFAGLCLLVRARVEGAPRTLWVDGLTAALAAAALSAAVVLQAVLRHGRRQRARRRHQPRLPGRRPHPARPWSSPPSRCAAGASIAPGRCSAWASCSSGSPTPTTSSPSPTRPTPTRALWDGGWTSCLVLFSAAAWQPARRTVAVEDSGAMRFTAFPIAFAASAWASSSSPRSAR